MRAQLCSLCCLVGVLSSCSDPETSLRGSGTPDASAKDAGGPSCAVANGGCSALVTCSETASGPLCGACPSGYSGTGATECVDVDECTDRNGGCDALATCTNTVGSRTCGFCPLGYSGGGDAACLDIDECALNTDGCDSVSACTNTAGAFTCGNCPSGYTGGGLSGCVDTDECVTNSGGCDALTVCQNRPGSRTCTSCPAGYTGTGETGCVDVDECATNRGGCDPLSSCTNTPGARTCSACPAGYSGSGATACVNINDCAPNSCLNGGTCVDGVNSFACTCPAGYGGPTCAIALGTGADGAATITAGLTNLSTTSVAANRSCADGGDAVSYSVTALTATTATLAVSPSSGCLAVNDEVLLINLQGTAAANSNVGNYETLRVASVAGATITFSSPKSRVYGNAAADESGLGTTPAHQRVVMLRVPNFASITVSAGATVTVDPWDGVKGGVLYLRSAGAVTIAGSLSLDGKGYRGGASPPNTFQDGDQGESYGGVGAGFQAALLGGGGGGPGEACADFGSAGGGAGYGTVGLNGSSGCAGQGAASYGFASLIKLYFGSGGGSGGNDNVLSDNPRGGRGGAGGGILVIRASSIAVTGSLSSRGGAGQGDTTSGCFGDSIVECWDYSGPGGGGAGGSLYLYGGQIDVGTSLVTAVEGAAGLGGSTDAGAGGVGRIAFRYVTSITGTSTPAADVAVGP